MNRCKMICGCRRKSSSERRLGETFTQYTACDDDTSMNLSYRRVIYSYMMHAYMYLPVKERIIDIPQLAIVISELIYY